MIKAKVTGIGGAGDNRYAICDADGYEQSVTFTIKTVWQTGGGKGKGPVFSGQPVQLDLICETPKGYRANFARPYASE